MLICCNQQWREKARYEERARILRVVILFISEGMSSKLFKITCPRSLSESKAIFTKGTLVGIISPQQLKVSAQEIPLK